jgi:2-polyprenyl-6-methoxyphenol hydroxylase-like FAD-dependent oxidoreductase
MTATASSTTQVIIAGAGPVGLMLAAELRLGGIDVLVLEKRPTGTVSESRAPGINARSMEIFVQRGLADEFRRLGKPMSWVVFCGIFLEPTRIDPGWPHALILPQHETERILAARAVELGAEIRWATEVVGVEQNQDGVEVLTRTPTGTERVRGTYVVGCDGGHSAIRKLSDIAFPGLTGETWWVVGDLDLATPPEQAFNYTEKVGFYQISRTEPGWVRLSLMRSTPPPDPAEPVTLDEVRETMIDGLGTDYGLRGARWISQWSDGYRHAESYRKGRVFLAGDAGHTHTPVGGQGLNLGIQDAVNLGWKLAAVLRGDAADRLLDTYHEERYPAGTAALKWSMAQTEVLKPGPRRAAIREVFDDLLAIPDAGAQICAGISGLGLRYPLGEQHPLVGRRLPNLSLVTEAGPVDVFTLLRDARPLLIDFGTAVTSDIAKPWANRMSIVTARYEPDRSGDSWHFPVFGVVPAFDAVLVRPDGYVAWIKADTEPFEPQSLTDALTRWVRTIDPVAEHGQTEKGPDIMTNGIDGRWAISFNTPGGDRSTTLTITADSTGNVTGTYDGVPIIDGRVSGNELVYSARLTTPFKIKVRCRATVDGGAMTGTAKAAMMSMPFTGTRIT